MLIEKLKASVLDRKLERTKEFIIYDKKTQDGIVKGSEYGDFYITIPYINNDYYKINDRIAFIDDDMYHVIAGKTFKLREIHFFRDKQNYDIMLESKGSLTREEERRIVNNFRKSKGEDYLPLPTSELNKLLYLPAGHLINGKEALAEYIKDGLQISNVEILDIEDENGWGYEIRYEATDNPNYHFIYHYLKDAKGSIFIHETNGQS